MFERERERERNGDIHPQYALPRYDPEVLDIMCREVLCGHRSQTWDDLSNKQASLDGTRDKLGFCRRV